MEWERYGEAIGAIIIVLGAIASGIITKFVSWKPKSAPQVPPERAPSTHEYRKQLDEFHHRIDYVTGQLRSIQNYMDTLSAKNSSKLESIHDTILSIENEINKISRQLNKD